MSWHRKPSGDDWRQVTPRAIAGLGQRLWLRCNACAHTLMVDPLAFAERQGIDPDTPLLEIGAALKCSRCGAQKAHCWPEPYAIGR